MHWYLKKKYHFNIFLIEMYFCKELSIVIQKTYYAMHFALQTKSRYVFGIMMVFTVTVWKCKFKKSYKL
jgi:hypothetical protein